MIEDLSFTSINVVIKAWEQAKLCPGFEEKLGMDVLLRLFALDSDVHKVFGFPNGPVKPFGMQQMAFLIHGKRVVGMIESTIALLGPDVEMLEDFLSELGIRHHRVGVKAQHFALLGRAFSDVLRDLMGSTWTAQVQSSWEEVFAEITETIVRSMPSELDSKTAAVSSSSNTGRGMISQ